MRKKFHVTVQTASGQFIPYSDTHTPWATDVRVTRSGDLKIWAGWKMRVFHPAGRWISYTVETDTPVKEYWREHVDGPTGAAAPPTDHGANGPARGFADDLEIGDYGLGP